MRHPIVSDDIEHAIMGSMKDLAGTCTWLTYSNLCAATGYSYEYVALTCRRLAFEEQIVLRNVTADKNEAVVRLPYGGSVAMCERP